MFSHSFVTLFYVIFLQSFGCVTDGGPSPTITFTRISTELKFLDSRIIDIQWKYLANFERFQVFCPYSYCLTISLHKNITTLTILIFSYSNATVIFEIVGLCFKNFSVSLMVPEEVAPMLPTTDISEDIHKEISNAEEPSYNSMCTQNIRMTLNVILITTFLVSCN